jgi:hypothetical protein
MKIQDIKVWKDWAREVELIQEKLLQLVIMVVIILSLKFNSVKVDNVGIAKDGQINECNHLRKNSRQIVKKETFSKNNVLALKGLI